MSIYQGNKKISQVSVYSDTSDTIAAEVVQARVDVDGNGHSTLKNRLDSDFNDLQNQITTTNTKIDTEVDGIKEDLGDLENKVELLVKKETKIYGFRINPNEADPYEAVVYLADAVGMVPAKMGTEAFDYGSWKDAFFMPRPCMVKYDGTVDYYLNPDNYKEKEDGSPSDVANADYEGNAMMEFPKIWYKFEPGSEDGEGYFYCSNAKPDDTYHCWCNYNCNDEIVPHFYTAIYNSTLHNGKFRSLSGFALTKENGSGYTTGAQEVTYATANNPGDDAMWYTDVYADRILINALLVLISKSLNTQSSFGRGLDTGEEATKNAYVTGSLNDKGLFYGVTANGNSGVKVFGMENWLGCIWRRTAGCISAAHEYKVKLTYGTADGSGVVGYNSTGTGYISTGSIPTSNGYVTKFKYSEYGYMPFAVGGSTSTYYSDYYYQNIATHYLLVGGNSGNGLLAGAFFFILGVAFSGLRWDLSAALSCKPLA